MGGKNCICQIWEYCVECLSGVNGELTFNDLIGNALLRGG